ncbi:GPI ethanolamine phosphate transferase 1 [Planococcus citri]|uniref:GPI ethanolamine phosphate transferase 1 n=1 Tax=Planococcus citri TaxID=170843 RepID=UPI0031F9EC56
MFYANHKWMLVICFFVHVIFLISIFDIYFKSPIVEGVIPSKNYVHGPAKRLVLFVGDGLRADSFLNTYNESQFSAPHLRQIIEQRGRWGISHTRVPTESRPGHVAIIAGFYEDPSAIFKGWKDNPIDFDSVFNRTFLTLGWGSPDILSMFNRGETKSRVIMKSYPESFEEFSGKEGSAARSSLWSFEEFKKFLLQAKSDQVLFEKLNQGEILFFLHLLGIDTAGHADKPHSDVYLQNIKVADDIVRDTESLINDFFNDDRTAFLFTSDHGMTDWGSHGEGSLHETETPYVAWGAGILPPERSNIPVGNSDSWKLNHLQRNDIKQADLAPLMSILLGIPIPVNSVGLLPLDILDMSESDKSAAILVNSFQMLNQFNRKRQLVEETTLSFLYKPYKKLSNGEDRKISDLLQIQLQNGHYNDVTKGSIDLISLCLSGLDYYHNYYQKLLLFCISVSYIGWMGWMFLNILSGDEYKHRNSLIHRIEELKKKRLLALHLIFSILLIVSVLLLFIQYLPLQYYLYCGTPIIIWWNVFRKIISSHYTTNYTRFSCGLLLEVFMTVVGTELVVLSFFERRLLSIIILTLAIWLPLHQRKENNMVCLPLFWAGSCVFLAIFPFLPVIGGKPNIIHLIISASIWCIFIGICWIITSNLEMRFKTRLKAVKIYVLFLVVFVVAICNVVLVFHSYSTKEGLYVLNQLLSWFILFTVPVVPLCVPRVLLLRLLSIYFSLGVVALLFSINHDALFLPNFSFNLFLWVLMESSLVDKYRNNELKLLQAKFQSKNTFVDQNLNASDFRRAFLYFFYTVFSFFGTGNIASINSFDTSWVRCFITLFAPFTMMILILIKTVIPFFVTACTFRAITDLSQVRVDRMFLIVLLYCDLMGLNFLFFVKNVGSWLQIGESVSHYVISQTIIMFLVLLYFVSGFLTCGKAPKIISMISVRKWKNIFKSKRAD